MNDTKTEADNPNAGLLIALKRRGAKKTVAELREETGADASVDLGSYLTGLLLGDLTYMSWAGGNAYHHSTARAKRMVKEFGQDLAELNRQIEDWCSKVGADPSLIARTGGAR